MSNAIAMINKSLEVAQFEFDNLDFDSSFRTFNSGPDIILFQGREAQSIIEECILVVHSDNEEIFNTISEKAISNRVIDLLKKLNSENRNCNKDDIQFFKKDILSIPKETFEVISEIFGVTLEDDQIKIGDFTIYNNSINRDNLYSKYPLLKKYEDLFFDEMYSPFLIGVQVTSRDKQKAYELADEYFKSFENTLHFIIRDLDHMYRPGIFNFVGNRNLRTIAVSLKESGQSNKSIDTALTFNLNKAFFTHHEISNIVGLITNNNKSIIQKRLQMSIEWVGKAIHDNDLPKSLVQYVIAIEGLLQMQEKVFISASISSQICEWIALIIGNNYEEKINYIKIFKDIYSKRSAVAHGATKKISTKDIITVNKIAYKLILTLLFDENFKNMKNIEDLNEWIGKKKFQ